MDSVVDLTAKIDYALSLKNATLRAEIQNVFGLPNVTDVRDFVNTLICALVISICVYAITVADRKGWQTL
jgi:hypothetical protein